MLGAAFFMGLVGSMHCIGMCGPLAIVANRMGAGQSTSTAITYNTSRIVVYILLGLLFGALGQVALVNGLQKWLSVILGVAITILALTMIFRPQVNHFLTGQFGFAFKVMGKIARPQGHGLKNVAILGLVNGFLPCGLVYMAVAGAAIQPTLLESGLFMVTFGLGTLPLMFSLSYSGNHLLKLIQGNYRRILSFGLFAFGIFLLYRGLGMEFTTAISNMFDPTGSAVICK